MSSTENQSDGPITKKVCMLGASAVGKTSLVRRYVHGIFDEQYKTTIGVKIEEMNVTVEGRVVKLILWDLEGYDDPLQEYREIQIPGADGYVLVVDGTRPETLDIARKIQQLAGNLLQGKPAMPILEPEENRNHDVPFVAVLNKRDLTEEWMLRSEIWNELTHAGWTVYETSAKTGENVLEAFETLVRKMLQVDSERGDETIRVEGEAGVTVREEL